MGMDVDEARSDDMTARVDFLGSIAADRADMRDEAVPDRDVACESVIAGSVDDGGIADDQIECRHLSLHFLLKPCYHSLWSDANWRKQL